MAFTAFRAALDSAGPTTYTVPANKVAIFTFEFGSIGAGTLVVQVDSDTVATLSAYDEVKPLTATAGQVISVAGSTAVGYIVGLLFDSTSNTFNSKLTTVGPDTYTVPANKVAIFMFSFGSVGAGTLVVQVAGTTVATMTAYRQVKPMTANAGEVVSLTGTAAVGYICGILVDV